MKCDRCQDFTAECSAVLFDVYHALLCRSCKNDFQIWIRDTIFWRQHLEDLARHTYLTLPLYRIGDIYDDIVKQYRVEDMNKLEAFPLIAAWVHEGKTA